MATEVQIPEGQAEREALVRALHGAIGPEAFRKIVDVLQAETGEEVRTAVRQPLSLAKATEALGTSFNFEALQRKTARDFERWGIEKGPAAYVIPENASVGESGDLDQLKALFEAGREQPAILVVPNMKPADLFHVLFVEAGLPVDTCSYGYKNLNELRKINPRDIPGLAELDKKSSDQQLAAFAQAHGKAPALRSPGVRILFTPESQHAEQSVGESATRIVQRTGGAGEVPHLNLAAEFVRARQMVDAALKKVVDADEFEALFPDAYRAALARAFKDGTIHQYMPAWGRGSVTRSPLEVFLNGGVSALHWYPEYRYFRVEDSHPATDDDDLACRASLA